MNMQAMMTAYYGLAFKEISRVMRIWGQTLLPSVVTITLYFLIFGRIIGDRVGMMSGVPYMLYITPGLIMMAVIVNAYSNISSSFFAAKFNRNIEEILVSPMPISLIIFGYLSASVFRGIFVGLLTCLVAILLGKFNLQHPLLTFIVFILSSTLFGFIGLLNGIYANKFDDIAIVTTFVLTPLIYLGGVFYNISALSQFWRYVSYCNPIHYVIDLFRYAMLGIHAENSWPLLLMLITLINIVLYMACHYCLAKGTGMRV